VSARWLFPLVVLAVVVLNTAIFVDFQLLDTGFERHPDYYRLELREPNGFPAPDIPRQFSSYLHFDSTDRAARGHFSFAVFAFFLAIYTQGWIFGLLLGRRLGLSWVALAAYPLGLVLWVLVSAAIAVSPLSWQPASMGVAWLALAAAGAAGAWRTRGLPGGARPKRARDEWLSFAAATLGFAALTAIIGLFDVSVWTYDSHVINAMGRTFAHHGSVHESVAADLLSRGAFQAFVQGASAFLGVSALQAAPLILALCFLALFGLLGIRATTGYRLGATCVGLAIAAMATNYWMVVQALYVHENFAAGVYLFLFAACFWLAEREEETAWLPFAWVFLIGFALQRVETPLVALLLIGIAHSQSRFPARWLDRGQLVVALVLGVQALLWLSYWSPGYTALRAARPILDPERIAFVMAAIVASVVGVRVLRWPRLGWLRRWAPALVFAALVFGIGLAFWLNAERSRPAMGFLAAHLVSRQWGALWPAFAVLGLGLLRLPALPHRAVLSWGALTYLAAMFLYSRGARIGWGDSGNRALTHVVPLLFFFFVAAYGRGTLTSDRAGEDQVEASPSESATREPLAGGAAPPR